jgi:hypothetical protein
MKLFLPPLQIGPDEGFTKEKDIFGRAAIGQGLTSLVSNVTDPMVVALDSQWGSGKTTFLKMWAGELRKAGFPVVMFDAFAHDYMSDAFTAIAGEIIKLAEEKRRSEEPASKAFYEKASRVARIISRGILRTGVKAATLGVLDAADIETAASDIAKETSEMTDKTLGEWLTASREEKELLESFEAALSELPSLLSSPPSESKPLVFIIDELDRCRPDFSLEILERMKHFFSVKNVHFVLGIDVRQLQEAVKIVYGLGIDARVYLQKFINLHAQLDTNPPAIEQSATTIFINHAIETFDFPKHKGDLVGCFRNLLIHVADKRGLSLREIERILSIFAIEVAQLPESHRGELDPIIAGLPIIQVLDRHLYKFLLQGMEA